MNGIWMAIRTGFHNPSWGTWCTNQWLLVLIRGNWNDLSSLLGHPKSWWFRMKGIPLQNAPKFRFRNCRKNLPSYIHSNSIYPQKQWIFPRCFGLSEPFEFSVLKDIDVKEFHDSASKTLPKIKISPENWRLEDAFPIEDVPFFWDIRSFSAV